MERWCIGEDAERREIDPATVAVIATRTMHSVTQQFRRVSAGKREGSTATATQEQPRGP